MAFILLPEAAFLITFSDIFRGRHHDGNYRGFGGGTAMVG